MIHRIMLVLSRLAAEAVPEGVVGDVFDCDVVAQKGLEVARIAF